MRRKVSAASRRLADFVELTKPNIVVFILATVTAGYYLGSSDALSVGTLVHALIGSALVAAGSNALNQLLEREIDARMRRTRTRPLPSGRLHTSESAVFAWVLGVLGVGYLLVFTNAVVALLAAATLGSYVFVYTPLKRLTSLSTLVGAVPGALPIVGGGLPQRARSRSNRGYCSRSCFYGNSPISSRSPGSIVRTTRGPVSAC